MYLPRNWKDAISLRKRKTLANGCSQTALMIYLSHLSRSTCPKIAPRRTFHECFAGRLGRHGAVEAFTRTKRDVIDIVSAIEQRGAPVAANKALKAIKTLLPLEHRSCGAGPLTRRRRAASGKTGGAGSGVER